VSRDGRVARRVLAGGLRLIVRENRAAPVVAMTLLVEVGSAYETPEVNGLTALLGRVSWKGTDRRSAAELVQVAEDCGGDVESATDQEYAELRVRGLARHWQTLLELLGEVATRPSLLAEEIERERAALLSQIRGLEDQPAAVASRLLGRALYGDHSYALPTAGSVATVSRLGRSDLVRHLETFFVPGRMVLAVSGDIAAAAVLDEAAKAFGSLARAGAGPRPGPAPGRPAVARASERRDTQQAQLHAGVLAPPLGDPDHVALKVASEVLGGGMSSRLFRTLRDEAGLAYAVGSMYPSRRLVSRIVAHVGTAPRNLAVAEAGIRRELGRLADEAVPADELVRAKAQLLGGLALDLRTTARQAFYLGFFELMGPGPDYLDRYPVLVESVTAEEVRRAAARYLTDPSVATVGPDEAPDRPSPSPVESAPCCR